MNITEIPLSVVRFQYQLLRRPLQLIEDRVIARMPAEAPARLVYERSLGVLDATVGNVLSDRRLEHRGGALVQRSDALSHAAALDAQAARTQQQADADLKAHSEAAAEDQNEARAAKEEAIEQARTTAEERKRTATESAKERTAAATKQADEVAARRKDSAEAAKRQEHQRVQATEKQATDAAAAKAKDAQAKRGEAESTRAQANRVEMLADREKQKRRSEGSAKP
jgi:hypothetical protein